MPTVKQFGFAPGAGALANLVDGNDATSWTPLATNFSAYPAQFMTPDGASLNYGSSFPAIEWDFGEPTRAVSLNILVESPLTLGPAVLIGSDNPATSTANTLQSGDVLLATYNAQEIVSNNVLTIALTTNSDVRFRYYRLLQRSALPSVAVPAPTNSKPYESGAGSHEVGPYTDKFIIELWGAGASGGVSDNAQDGGNSTCSTYSLTAEGGNKATATVPNAGTGAGTGGAASGGNTANIPGGDGSPPSPVSPLPGFSGKGGDCPNGSPGGAGVGNNGHLKYGDSPWGSKASSVVIGGSDLPGGTVTGAPGGGGSGMNLFSDTVLPSWYKYPGGGAGGYVKHVLTKGIDGPDEGDLIAFTVGVGGVSTQPDGGGANGRARFSWT